MDQFPPIPKGNFTMGPWVNITWPGVKGFLSRLTSGRVGISGGLIGWDLGPPPGGLKGGAPLRGLLVNNGTTGGPASHFPAGRSITLGAGGEFMRPCLGAMVLL